VKALLLHLDGKLPNVALMRIAAHHRALGDDIEFRRAPTTASVEPSLFDRHDRVYASLIFERTRPVAERLLLVRPDAVVGGTGWDVTATLEARGIVTASQDYSIYPGWTSSIGFTQRGCRLKCPFCVVPRKEGEARDHQTVADIWRGDPFPRQIILLDNDFFGGPAWRERVRELRAGRFKVCFSQGINARALDDETAEAIASLDYRADNMKERRIYTAWDNAKDEGRLFAGLEKLRAFGVLPSHIMVYMLIGYWPGETPADRDSRRRKLRDFGAVPYPMPFVRTPELVAFQRWVVGAYDKRVGWAEWWGAGGRPENLGSRAQRALPLFSE
jgi:hypothetical protein